MSERDRETATDQAVAKIEAEALIKASRVEPYPDLPMIGEGLHRQLAWQIFNDDDP